MAELRAEGLGKSYGGRAALAGVDLVAPAGKLTAVLGPSGGGKSTFLRLLAGLEAPDAGALSIGGRPASAPGRVLVEPRERGVGFVFQSYALWPHLSAFENVAFPLRARGASEDELRRRVEESGALARLPPGLERLPHELSGGEQQRVAIARALVYRPQVLLFDEPLANLDARVREELRAELGRLQRRLGVTAVYVTHDQGEALALADRVVLLDAGRVIGEGAPAELWRRPATAAAARFLGATNRLAAMRREGAALAHGVSVEAHGLDAPEGAPLELLLRPDDLRPSGEGRGWAGRVAAVEFQGETAGVRLEGEGFVLQARVPAEEAPAEGALARYEPKPGRGLVYRI